MFGSPAHFGVSSMRWKLFASTVVGLLIIEGLSYLGWLWPTAGVIFWVILVFLTFIATSFSPVAGVSIVVAELIVGGKGYLFSLPEGGQDISFRLGIFLAVFAATLMHLLRRKSLWGAQWRFRWVWLAFLGLAVWAAFVGVLRGHGLGNVFLDANAYLYIGAVPLFGLLRSREEFRRVLWVSAAAIGVLAIKTAFVQGLFAHYPSTELVQLYKWVRDTGVGEITWIIGRLYRVFFQSHVWGLFAFFTGLGLAVADRKRQWFWTTIAGLGAYVVIVSLSRSFWLGGIAAAVVSLGGLLARRSLRSYFPQVVLASGVALLLAYVGFLWTLNFPGLWGGAGGSGSLVRNRTDIATESAASSRRELLPAMHKKILEHALLGNGFGTSITYRTLDPRVNVTHDANGTLYTARAFELGYHGFAVHAGVPITIVLLAAFIWVLMQGVHILRLQTTERPLVAGLLASGVALMVLHLTTPYLNHPLGLGMLILITTGFALADPRYGHR